MSCPFLILFGLTAFGGARRDTLIWTPPGVQPASRFLAFRRALDLSVGARTATLHVFVDSRYLVWINGKYVVRGPARTHRKMMAPQEVALGKAS